MLTRCVILESSTRVLEAATPSLPEPAATRAGDRRLPSMMLPIGLHTRPNTLSVTCAGWTREIDAMPDHLVSHDAFANDAGPSYAAWPHGTWCTAHGIDAMTDVSSYCPLDEIMVGECPEDDDPEIFAMMARCDAMLAIRSVDVAFDAMVIS